MVLPVFTAVELTNLIAILATILVPVGYKMWQSWRSNHDHE